MSKKYVIKNCPAITTGWHDTDYICNTHKMGCEHCKDCTDCVLKQIIKRCRKEQEYHKEWQKETGFNYAATGLRLANDILELLDIEECE